MSEYSPGRAEKDNKEVIITRHRKVLHSIKQMVYSAEMRV